MICFIVIYGVRFRYFPRKGVCNARARELFFSYMGVYVKSYMNKLYLYQRNKSHRMYGDETDTCRDGPSLIPSFIECGSR